VTVAGSDAPIGAIILAAGESKRFGSPKVLQRFGGTPFLTRILTSLRGAGVDEVILVIGHQAQQLAPLISRVPEAEHARVVVNPRFEEGQLSSVQAGIRAVKDSVQGVLLCLIDQPHLEASTYREVAQEARRSPGRIVIPACRARRGHPVFLPRRLFADVLHPDAPCTLRDVISRHGDTILVREVEDPGVCEDIDTREDLARLEQAQYRRGDQGRGSVGA
jgi:CTP:molybdopterin cytidylyltransferase MocA